MKEATGVIKLKQAVIVEGRYDKARLASLVDATILTTEGFRVFRDREKLALIRRLAAQDGIILLTDSDAAGFRIRRYLAGAVPKEQITHVYIPDLWGKEKRKAHPSAEGKLGVEGIPNRLLLEAFRRAGISVQETAEPPKKAAPPAFTKADLMEWGLSGGPDSAARRRALLTRLGLPQRLNANGLLEMLNRMYDRQTIQGILQELDSSR